MPKDVFEKATQELKKLEAMPPMSAESTVSRNYLDWLLAVPWKKKSKENRSIDHAEKVLNEDHYGLEKIKERILEFLAVRQLVKNPKGSILCFVGPPGVGKTSLGMSIAKATGRKFVRMSLGGVRDEAEIRGHRRTYIGALARPDHPVDEKGRHQEPRLHARRSRQDGLRLPRRSRLGAARSARSRAEHHLPGPLPRRRIRPVAGALRRHGQRAAHHPRPAAGPHGDPPPARLHRDRKARDRQAVPASRSSAKPPASPRRTSPSPTTASLPSSAATPAKPASATWSARSATSAARSARRVVKNGLKHKEEITAENLNEFLGVPKFRDSAVHEKSEVGLVTGLAWTEVGGSILAHRSAGARRQRQAHPHRPARRRDAGVGAGRALLHPQPRRSTSACRATSTATSTSTSTCPRARSPRTAPPPASPWPPPSPAR